MTGDGDEVPKPTNNSKDPAAVQNEEFKAADEFEKKSDKLNDS
jgi:hypothetical protein